jgi:hypothetical protein
MQWAAMGINFPPVAVSMRLQACAQAVYACASTNCLLFALQQGIVALGTVKVQSTCQRIFSSLAGAKRLKN